MAQTGERTADLAQGILSKFGLNPAQSVLPPHRASAVGGLAHKGLIVFVLQNPAEIIA
jgi:hypothetical protein